MVSFDLHTHSCRSDGLLTPGQVADKAVQAGLTGLALTDHDTCAGWEDMAEACAARGLQFVPGLELSAEDGGHSVHLLGYWVDAADEALASECARLATERWRRARDIVACLEVCGISVTLADVESRAGGAPIGRPHVAEVLVEQGVVPDMQAAFDRFLGEGQPAHVPKHALSPEAAVRLIRNAGGVAVLAHPAARGTQPLPVALLDRLVGAGLAGVEVHHPGHDEDAVLRWRRLAEERDLVVTGSSDFHGRSEEETMGRSTTPAGVVEQLADRAACEVTFREEAGDSA